MNTAQITKLYFELSNEHDIDGIAKLLTDSTTYSSVNTGVYLGVEQIIKMQTEFHASFKKLYWKINSLEEIRSGVVLIDFTMSGEKKTGEIIKTDSIEYVVSGKEKIHHIEVRAKLSEDG